MPQPMLPAQTGSPTPWDETLYAFLAEKGRRSGSPRTSTAMAGCLGRSSRGSPRDATTSGRSTSGRIIREPIHSAGCGPPSGGRAPEGAAAASNADRARSEHRPNVFRMCSGQNETPPTSGREGPFHVQYVVAGRGFEPLTFGL